MIYAPFWKRLAALLIDLAVLVFIYYLLGPVLSKIAMLLFAVFLMLVFSGATQSLAPMIILFAGFALLIDIIIGTVLTLFDCSPLQGTPGKIITGIKICGIDGKRIGFFRALARNILKFFSVLSIIAAAAAGFTKNKQSLHDIICDTLVINKSSDTSNLQVPKTPLQNKFLMIGALIILFFTVQYGLTLLNQKTGIISWLTAPVSKFMNSRAAAEWKANAEKSEARTQQFINSLQPAPVVDNTVHRTDQETLDITRKLVVDLSTAMENALAKYGNPNRIYDYVTNLEVGTGERSNFKISAYVVNEGGRITVTQNRYFNTDTNKTDWGATVEFKDAKTCADYGQGGTNAEAMMLCGLLTSGGAIPDNTALSRQLEDVEQQQRESLDEVMRTVAVLKKAFADYIAKNGPPYKNIDSYTTLDMLNVRFPNRERDHIKVNDYMIAPTFKNTDGDYMINIYTENRGGFLINGPGRSNMCMLEAKWCQYLKENYGLVDEAFEARKARGEAVNRINNEGTEEQGKEFINSLPPPPVIDNTVRRTEQETLDLTRRLISDFEKIFDDAIAKSGKPHIDYRYAAVEVGTGGKSNFKIDVSFAKNNYRIYSIAVTQNRYFNTDINKTDWGTTVVFSYSPGDKPCGGVNGLNEEVFKLCELLRHNGPAPAQYSKQTAQTVSNQQLPPSAPKAAAAAPSGGQADLDKAVQGMSDIATRLYAYLAKNGKPANELNPTKTLEALGINSLAEEFTSVKASNYIFFAVLSPNYGGYYILAKQYGGYLRLQADGQKLCHMDLYPNLCTYAKQKYGFVAN